MRRVSRGLLVAMMTVALAMPAAAAKTQDSSNIKKNTPVVKSIKKIVRAFSDLLTIPKP